MAETTNESAGPASKDPVKTPAPKADPLREGMEKAREAFTERVVEPAKRAGEAVRAAGQKWAEGNAAVNLKMIDQAELNVQAAFSAMRKAASAKDLSEVMRIQADFLQEQAARSAEQSREVGEMIARVGREAVAPLTPGDSATT